MLRTVHNSILKRLKRFSRYGIGLVIGLALPNVALAQMGTLEVGASVGLGSQKQTNWVVPFSMRASIELDPQYALGIVGGYFHQRVAITGLQSLQDFYVTALRFDYRYYQFDNFKLYGALELGYLLMRRLDESTNPVFPLSRRMSSSALAWAAVGGVGYTFHKNFEAFVELGYGWSNSRVGIAYRFAKPEGDN